MNPYVELPGFQPWKAWRVASTASTMEDARLLASKAKRGFIVADFQSAGRGRLEGRVWRSEAGRSLLVSFWLPASDFMGVPPPLACGLALREACMAWAESRNARLSLSIKWPNDLYADGKKLAGILCESFRAKEPAGGLEDVRAVIAGFGLNLSQTEFPGEYRSKPCSLFTECGLAPDPLELAAYLAESMADLPTEGWLKRLNACLHGRGKAAAFRDGLGNGREIVGTLAGVAPDGSILIDCGGITRSCASGELIPQAPVAD